MPKAFTHLCKKVNLSLYDNTLTVYPKPDRTKSPSLPQAQNELELLFLLLFSKMDCVSAEVNDFFMTRQNELGVYRFVHRDDADHYLYHQDGFKMDDDHYHAQFAISINEGKLDSILGTLEKYSIISPEEHTSFVKAYHDANTLPHDPKQILASGPKVDEKPVPAAPVDVAAKQDKKPYTFGGLKVGFFNQQPAHHTPDHSTSSYGLVH
ncbi:Uncharacterised protein [Legionella steigerwaltii]|uniref:Uncharacterized protein n=1 Tax=Legionella steigerwaltii TaxID=460 RepID=A0A378L9R6_9GAMM|nr:hypothetical protein [Legionella steigerwaltii]KTD75414.1 hypothetical protein Lstg_2441 [Legionella steigerwaltii]STY22618.1 Uncharacterised protein [Legionella steigerwaltii]